jgi:hypothetical protein
MPHGVAFKVSILERADPPRDMDHSENSMLVYLAGALGARPTAVAEFTNKALHYRDEVSETYRKAIGHLTELVAAANPTKSDGYRHRLLGLARDHEVVSRYSDGYPLSAAKSAILTALDY